MELQRNLRVLNLLAVYLDSNHNAAVAAYTAGVSASKIRSHHYFEIWESYDGVLELLRAGGNSDMLSVYDQRLRNSGMFLGFPMCELDRFMLDRNWDLWRDEMEAMSLWYMDRPVKIRFLRQQLIDSRRLLLRVRAVLKTVYINLVTSRCVLSLLDQVRHI